MSEIRKLLDSDYDSFVSVRKTAFPHPDLPDDELRRLLEPRLEHSTGLFVDDRLACVATMYQVQMFLAGHIVPMGALAGVASGVPFRRRGYIRDLLVDWLRRLHEQGVGWCLEYPFDPRFYGRLGWQSVPIGVQLELPVEILYRGRGPDAWQLELDLAERLTGIYRKWAANYSFTLTREFDPRGVWDRITSKRWLNAEAFLFRTEEAYLLYTIEREGQRQVADVADYAFTNPAGRKGALALLGSLQGQIDAVRMHLPASDPLVLDFGHRFAKLPGPRVQARVVDLTAALAPLTSAGEWRCTVAVRDEQCDWNDGVFELVSSPEGTRVERSNGEPQLELPIRSLPLLISGQLSARTALLQGFARGESETLAAIVSLGGGFEPFMPYSDAF